MRLSQQSIDELFMLECLSLAEKGRGRVSPNPMVGAVIVKNNKVLSRGYHQKFGGPHAEVHAIRNATTSVRGSTLYVNLEPCNYFGKTPPCTDLIISSGIKTVVVGMLDPNPIVSGKGIRQLRTSGVNVRTGILGSECNKLNEIFIKYIKIQRPFVTVKIAQTIDGKIADCKGRSKWITNADSRELVHKLRSFHDAVLVGVHTVNLDNPRLTARGIKGRQPVRVILDGNFAVRTNSRIFSQRGHKTILFISEKSAKQHSIKKKLLIDKGIEVIECESRKKGALNLQHILKILGSKDISSVLVEGGASVFSQFIQQGIADKLLIFIAPKILGCGLGSFSHIAGADIKEYIHLHDITSWVIGNDLLIESYIKK